MSRSEVDGTAHMKCWVCVATCEVNTDGTEQLRFYSYVNTNRPHPPVPKMQFSLIVTTLLATLAAAAPVAVPKSTVVERAAAGGLPGLGALTSLMGSLGGGGLPVPGLGGQQTAAQGGQAACGGGGLSGLGLKA
ncbi:hypothetical protein BST61_g3924 [Cercospora zeina]